MSGRLRGKGNINKDEKMIGREIVRVRKRENRKEGRKRRREGKEKAISRKEVG